MPSVTVSSSPGAAGSWSEPLSVWREQLFDLSISGTFAATVYLQRCSQEDDPDTAANWHDVDLFTSPVEMTGISGAKNFWRIGVKQGGYTSGSVVAAVRR